MLLHARDVMANLAQSHDIVCVGAALEEFEGVAELASYWTQLARPWRLLDDWHPQRVRFVLFSIHEIFSLKV